MPSYLITDNVTGRKFKVTGDSPPSEQEIPQIMKDMGINDAPASRIVGNPDASPEETERMRRDFVRKEGTLGTRVKERLKTMTDFTEAPRFAAEAGVAMANAGLRGLKSVASTVQGGGEALRTGSLDAGLRRYENEQSEFTPIESPFKPSGLGQLAGDAITAGTTKLSDLTGRPDIVEPVVQGAMDIAALAGLRGVTKGVKVPGVDRPINKPAPIPKQKAVPRILSDYEKAVRPSVKGTGKSASQYDKAGKNYVDGVYDIVEAKNNGTLQLGREELGQAVENRLPKTLQEHLDATAQARVSAFNEYNNMKIQAGENGVTIDLQPVAATLRTASTDPALNVARPSVARYMREMADRFEKQGEFTPEQAQSALAKFNSLVDYTKVAPEVAENAMVDKSVAAQLREAMNQAIMADENPGYQAARLKYGRLAQMETEAAHRARVAGRQAPSSLFDGVVGALTASEIVAGLLSANPAMLARGGGMMTFKYWRNKMNSPDHQILRMYKTADKSFTGRTKPETPNMHPKPKKTIYDKAIGRRIPVEQGMIQRTPLGNPQGPAMVFDRSIGSTVPLSALGRQRTPMNNPQGQPTLYDLTIGAYRSPKNK